MAEVVSEVFEIMSDESLGNAVITLDSVREADHMARRRAGMLIEKKR